MTAAQRPRRMCAQFVVHRGSGGRDHDDDSGSALSDAGVRRGTTAHAQTGHLSGPGHQPWREPRASAWLALLGHPSPPFGATDQGAGSTSEPEGLKAAKEER